MGLWDKLIDRATRFVRRHKEGRDDTRKRPALHDDQKTTKRPTAKVHQNFSKKLTNKNTWRIESTVKSSQAPRGSPVSFNRELPQHCDLQHAAPTTGTPADEIQTEDRLSSSLTKNDQVPRNSAPQTYPTLNAASSRSSLCTLHSTLYPSDIEKRDNLDVLTSDAHHNIDKCLSIVPSHTKNNEERVSIRGNTLSHGLDQDDDGSVHVNYTTHNRAPVVHEDVYPQVHTIYEPRRTRSIHLHEHIFYIQPVIDTSGSVRS